ncbi:MarR family winged helix-turn-helix transcriptional regulator [Flexivirga meconopsidis]|uniref:MarR family winged helix-turn-helix transcriptional regulator n=1 Tax=Flexivirga meconopsidis TaxID=2977121 RepID=UPI00223EE3CC|nr:MarR family transcriptional regulator [Flexivirga meconopsidis]
MTSDAKPPAARERETRRVLEQLRAFTRRLNRNWSSYVPELTFSDFMALRAVADLDVPTVQDIARELRIDKSSASRRVAALERDGHIERHQIPGERRAQELTLTDIGRRTLASAERTNLDTLGERMADWSDADIARLAQLLERLNR